MIQYICLLLVCSIKVFPFRCCWSSKVCLESEYMSFYVLLLVLLSILLFVVIYLIICLFPSFPAENVFMYYILQSIFVHGVYRMHSTLWLALSIGYSSTDYCLRVQRCRLEVLPKNMVSLSRSNHSGMLIWFISDGHGHRRFIIARRVMILTMFMWIGVRTLIIQSMCYYL